MSNKSRKIAERHIKIPAKGEKNFAFRNSEILLTANETGNALPTGDKLTDLLKTAIYIHEFNQSGVSFLAAVLPADAAPPEGMDFSPCGTFFTLWAREFLRLPVAPAR